MNPKRQRTAIAEACGWKFRPLLPPSEFDQRDYLSIKDDAIMCWVRPGGDDWQTQELPDYLNDLNACAEMQQHLGPAKSTHAKYWSMLHDMVVGEAPHGEEMDWRDLKAVGIATAAMKCECFLKAVGRWEP